MKFVSILCAFTFNLIRVLICHFFIRKRITQYNEQMHLIDLFFFISQLSLSDAHQVALLRVPEFLSGNITCEVSIEEKYTTEIATGLVYVDLLNLHWIIEIKYILQTAHYHQLHMFPMYFLTLNTNQNCLIKKM